MKASLREIGERINRHLKRFEADRNINTKDGHGLTPYFNAGAAASGRFVYVCYVSYQGHRHLTREEALLYLRWLDQGGIGRHYESQEKLTG